MQAPPGCRLRVRCRGHVLRGRGLHLGTVLPPGHALAPWGGGRGHASQGSAPADRRRRGGGRGRQLRQRPARPPALVRCYHGEKLKSSRTVALGLGPVCLLFGERCGKAAPSRPRQACGNTVHTTTLPVEPNSRPNQPPTRQPQPRRPRRPKRTRRRPGGAGRQAAPPAPPPASRAPPQRCSRRSRLTRFVGVCRGLGVGTR